MQSHMDLIGSNNWNSSSGKRKMSKNWWFRYKDSTMASALKGKDNRWVTNSQNICDRLYMFDGEICVGFPIVIMEEGSYDRSFATLVYFDPYMVGYEVYHLQRPLELFEFVFSF